MTAFDEVKKAAHYNLHPSGIECIVLVELLPFCLGNATKYVWRHGLKGATSVDVRRDLEKAHYYVAREIARVYWPEDSLIQQALAIVTDKYPRHARVLRFFGVRPWSYVDDVLLAHLPAREKQAGREKLERIVYSVLRTEALVDCTSPLWDVMNALHTLLVTDGEDSWVRERVILESLRFALSCALAKAEAKG